MRINVLGPMEVRISTVVPDIKGAKRYALLAALLLQPGRVVTRARLIDAIWDSSPPCSATANIRTYVSDLRKSLGNTADGRPRLVSDPTGYAIDVRPDELDLLDFEKLADEGVAAANRGDTGRAARCLGGAIRLWRGRPFDGIELGSWAQARITALEDRRCEVLSSWVDARLALGRHDDLPARLREMLAERPLAEHTWAQLMTALERAGRRPDALAVFAEARAVLRRDLGIEPGAELCRVRQRIRTSGQPGPAGATRARSASLPSRPCALPAVPQVVGRAAALAGMTSVLRLPAGGPIGVELSGPPGVGKTALAVAAAHRLRPSFPDGQLYQTLGGTTGRPKEPADVLASLLRSLGIAAWEIPDAVEYRSALFRATVAERRVLVVLDDAWDHAQVRPLLPGTGECRVIVSGRCGLTMLEGLRRTRLGPLSLGEAVELLRGVVGAERIAREPDAARRIARGCALVPLALKVAAARLAMRPRWPLADLADRLGDNRTRLDELICGDLSVRAGLEPSYLALPEEERRAVRLIATHGSGVLPGEAAAAVLDRPPARSDRIIEHLMCANLLDAVEVRDGRAPWYQLNELFALYARERVAAGSLVAEPA